MTSSRVLLTALVLSALTYALYASVTGFDFVSWDDPDYVSANARVRAGLDGEGLRWAFGLHGTAGNWHPLTWLSHMLDAELFGDEPGGHHRTSALLHAINAGLALLALAALTRAFWPSLPCAVLFAVHPLRVESVAWVSERKDVLSACFALALLLVYASWARRGGAGRYVALCVCFALGLLSKPMLVTWPCVLLLLDVWPLGRWGGLAPERSAVPADRRRSLGALFVEKLPLFALALASAWLTVLAQSKSGSIQGTDRIALAERLLHAPYAYLRYLELSCWPRALACFYPHPAVVRPGFLAPSNPLVWGALLFLITVTTAAWRLRRRLPALSVGWLWFAGMLVPVIGLVQVGGQSIADRYTYLPSLGLSVALVFPLWQACARRPALVAALVAALGAAALALVPVTRTQCETWRSSEALFVHALAVTRANYKAHNSYGVVLERAGRIEEARAEYEAALAIRPAHPQALTNLGKYWFQKGERARAEELFRRAVEEDPRLVSALGNLAAVLLARGELAGGVELLERALAIQEDHALHHKNLGLALRMLGRGAQAQVHLDRAAELDPSMRVR